VRAGVVDGVVLPAFEEHGDHPIVDLVGAALALGDLTDLGHGLERFGRQRTHSDPDSNP
jgi:hypothetical protein